MRHTPPMRSVSLYHRHRFPAEIISHCVWLYFRFALSFRRRNVSDARRFSHIRNSQRMVPQVRSDLREQLATQIPSLRRQVALDEVFLKINGRLHYLWRAVDRDGDVLDILVQSHRDKKAVKKFFRKLLKGLQYVPRVIITDKLRSYHAAIAEVLPGVEHLQQKYQNNRAENSHQPTRLRERVMRRFKSVGQAQRFLSAFGIITAHFQVGRHLYKAHGYREVMKSRFAVWQEVICAEAIVN